MSQFAINPWTSRPPVIDRGWADFDAEQYRALAKDAHALLAKLEASAECQGYDLADEIGCLMQTVSTLETRLKNIEAL